MRVPRSISLRVEMRRRASRDMSLRDKAPAGGEPPFSELFCMQSSCKMQKDMV